MTKYEYMCLNTIQETLYDIEEFTLYSTTFNSIMHSLGQSLFEKYKNRKVIAHISMYDDDGEHYIISTECSIVRYITSLSTLCFDTSNNRTYLFFTPDTVELL